jgi:hypothetical protein
MHKSRLPLPQHYPPPQDPAINIEYAQMSKRIAYYEYLVQFSLRVHVSVNMHYLLQSNE